MTVRIACAPDREEVWRLFIAGHAEVGMHKNFDRERVDWWITRMLQPELLDPLDTGPRGAIGVIGTSKHLEALAFLVIGGFWYSNKRHLEEFLVYVEPKHRSGELAINDKKQNGKTHFRALIDWMKEQSVIIGLPLMTGVFTLAPRTEAKIKVYEKMLPKAGAFFCFDPITHGSSGVSLQH